MFDFWFSFGGFSLFWSWCFFTFDTAGSEAGVVLACVYAGFAVWGILFVVVPRTLIFRGALTVEKFTRRQRIWNCLVAGLCLVPCGVLFVMIFFSTRERDDPLLFLLLYLGLGVAPLEAAYRIPYPIPCALAASVIPVGYYLVLVRLA
jgi:hypothetical protein